ncbi:MAG: putative rane protein [Mucilaginibacter sp.]|nr:putative rane protein [Mucilaginibacter sp.]
MTDKFIFRFVAAVSIFVIVVVIILNRHIIPGPATPPSFTPYLPLLNAILNGTCTILLLVSLYFIKQGKIAVHKRLNITTFCLSSTFLVSYILFHYLMQHDTLYGDTNGDGVLSPSEHDAAGGLRMLYLCILVPHIILAAGVLPLILLSFYRGLQMQVEKHKKLVRWAFPIWLYVTVTGVIVYLMISPYYHF